MDQERIPVTLLTGFLGSGKTTILNSWLRDPAFSDAAVIVNEFGEIGIDHALIASSNDNTIELSTGCLCCMVSGDLVNTLRELNEKSARGEIRPITRVLVETTGVADPVPVIQSLMTFPVARRYVLNRVVTVVDALHGLRTVKDFAEAQRQISVADDIILSKTDIGEAGSELIGAIGGLNPSARLLLSTAERPAMPSDILTPGAFNPDAAIADVGDWLKKAGLVSIDDGHDHTHGDHHHHHDHHHHDRHGDGSISSFTLTFDAPLEWDHVAHWLDALVIAHGDDLLRVKGFLNIRGQDRPVVVQAVQKLFHPPFQLPEWPGGDRASRLVFITRGLTRDFVAEVLATIQGRAVREPAVA